MTLYLVHEIWNIQIKWNVFQYCLSTISESTWSHTFIQVLFNVLITYTAVRIVWHIGKQFYLSRKWFGIFYAKKHEKLTKRLNYKYRNWDTRILVVCEESFIALTFGFIRPRIVISTGLLNLFHDEEVEAILLHERYHCLNSDPIKIHLSSLVLEGMNYVPVLKGLFHYYKTWTELLADRFAVREMGCRYTLGKVLLALSSHAKNQRHPVGVSFSNVAINYRILQVLEPDKMVRVSFLNLQSVLASLVILATMFEIVAGGCS